MSWNVEKVLEFLSEIDAIREPEDIGEIEAGNELYRGERYRIDLREIFTNEANNFSPEWLRRLELDAEVDELIRKAWESREVREDDAAGGPRNTSVFDILAWYQPIHFYGGAWGIYITTKGIVRLAEVAAGEAQATGGTAVNFQDPGFKRKCLLAGFSSLYLHEAYHHKVESFALRLAVIERRSSCAEYKENVYRLQLHNGVGPLEESLANADAYRRLRETKYSRILTAEIVTMTRRALAEFFKTSPPGYKKASNYFGSKLFEQGQHRLMSEIQEASVAISRDLNEWEVSPHLFRGFSNFNSNIWLVV